MRSLLLALCLFLPAFAQEDPRLLDIDPTYLAPYVSLGYEHGWRPDGRELHRPNLELLVPFGRANTQAVSLRLGYELLGDVESVEDLELLYTWLFDADDSVWQSLVLHTSLPTGGDPVVGGSWSIEGEYDMRWMLDDNQIWVNELHYNRNLSTGFDYLEGVSEFTRLLPDGYLVLVGAKLRCNLAGGSPALAARLGAGRSLDDSTTLGIVLQRPLTAQNGTYNDFGIELTLTRGF